LRKYKEVRKCRMCGRKFVVDKKKAKKDYNHKFYCNHCYRRYFIEKKEDD
jgi:uncharacterized protein YbaR (Trm112 family)